MFHLNATSWGCREALSRSDDVRRREGGHERSRGMSGKREINLRRPKGISRSREEER